MTAPKLRMKDGVCEVWEGDCRDVAAAQESGSCSLAILDGAYGYSKADWDRVSIDGLADWYRPHFEDVDRLCAGSASLYVWNTAAGWARLDPLIRSMGWTFRALVMWDKMSPPGAIGWRKVKAWPTQHEVCGFYARGQHHFSSPGPTVNTVWQHSLKALSLKTIKDGTTMAKCKSGGVVAKSIHPCQKPVAFARRMIEASTRPGERVWVPFGGTLRECIAARDIARENPDDARYVITAELNQDGPDYIGAALRQYHGRGTKPVDPSQTSLFGGA